MPGSLTGVYYKFRILLFIGNLMKIRQFNLQVLGAEQEVGFRHKHPSEVMSRLV